MVADKDGRGLLFVMVGPGGAGKNTIMSIAIERLDNLSKLITATTRPMRPGEINGVNYQFVDLAQFREMIDRDELLEHQEVTKGKFYGIPRANVDTYLDNGHDLVADIEVLGARILRQTYPSDTVMIFLTVPGNTEEEVLTTLRERMEQRRDNPTVIEERLLRARLLELPFQVECDYVIVNDDIDRTAEELITIIQQERMARRHPSQVTS
ncbi:guanylate kinase [Phototrophicus methaneseepsis]|uniref:Guanylate kinase n=1 Tax=Phototrophicus methaneseepsis TaxID=2710758 RepID=A0A7S8E711_9CHLR|nr:guanylate kinase [Phototrophicus methaneseepsis]QPC81515.1 guanylate kinase [Phototrophicus methaneseepsis]